MLCNNCKYYWHMAPDWTTPYGENACMKLDCQIDELVSECEHFVSTESPSDSGSRIGLGGSYE